MPVLIEGVCILLKKGFIIERYQGGYSQFIFDLEDQSKIADCDELLCLNFNNHEEARHYLKFLSLRGMKIILPNEENPFNTDAVLVDQVFGPSIRLSWLDFIFINLNSLSDKNKKDMQVKKIKAVDVCSIVIAASDQELEKKEETKVQGWARSEVSFPKDWEFKKSKSMDLEFMRMAENRSKLLH